MSELHDHGSCGCGCGDQGGEPTNTNWKQASDDEMVCWCNKVTKGEIRKAIQMGAYTLPLVKAATGACRGHDCKRLHPRGVDCTGDVMELIRIYHDGPPEWVTRGSCCGI